MTQLWLMVFALAGAAGGAQAAQCTAKSGSGTTVLVELYTSEGCDSCPAADRWLSSLAAQGYPPERVVPIAFHVDYWDYIGWKDPYAKGEFAARQRKLAQLRRPAFVYTPQVLLQGADFRRWSGNSFGETIAHINARPAKAALSLTLSAVRNSALDVELAANLLDPAQRGDAAVYLAAYENKLTSEVTAGENRGRTLLHDYVVREWLGPIPFPADLKLAGKHSLALPPNALPKNSGVASFVQNRSSGEVLQALMLPACPG